MDKLEVYTQEDLRLVLEAYPNAYVAVIKVEAVRLDTYLSGERSTTELPVVDIDRAKQAIAAAAMDISHEQS